MTLVIRWRILCNTLPLFTDKGPIYLFRSLSATSLFARCLRQYQSYEYVGSPQTILSKVQVEMKVYAKNLT